ncbi:hypothetical protein [Geminocystis sp. NIES-3709]|uniref:hypothetical protein n=1 Tax=Geminocystis sp. NIES-3709 TaxID=1617448 RepID=UPI0005FC540C|nr:hypothetical protein [Geminocystis sp. NIES-3709]BAQ64073.1 hypothetical protein GM3709_838 [Geminocystis sp. NIES-3709]
MDLGKIEQNINICIKILQPEGWILKNELVFIHIQKGLCYPTHKIFLQNNEVKKFKEILENVYINYRQKRESEGFPYDHYRSFFLRNRLFHISRLKEFDVINLSEL